MRLEVEGLPPATTGGSVLRPAHVSWTAHQACAQPAALQRPDARTIRGEGVALQKVRISHCFRYLGRSSLRLARVDDHRTEPLTMRHFEQLAKPLHTN